MEPMNFKSLNVINPIIRASTEAGFGRPTEIQQKVIPEIILNKDVFCKTKNDEKKVASFVIPIIQMMKKNMVDHRNIRVLIVSATNEEVAKVDHYFEMLSEYLPISKCAVLDGELTGSQIYQLRKGPDILMATPERLYNLILQGHCDFSKIETVVIENVSGLGELDLLGETSNILQKLPPKAQSVFFTEHLSKSVKVFAGKFLKTPCEINIPEEFSVKEKSSLPFLYIKDHSDMISEHRTNAGKGRRFAF
ncbi:MULTISPECIES: DEAD/DEAH box helicase [Chryseobacterium]|uniref:DEAD/DEAH box helicase n=1 Tax=Chryseobacterium sp. R2A-55 TaxID=2744445 RepID=UPI001F257FFF|nr:DEAD/DEAH box helicase [Chryseobacterium sp. R2A-55]